MADDKKNIGPEVEKTETAPAPEQPAHGKAEPVVADPAPAKRRLPWKRRIPRSRRFPALRLPSRTSLARRPSRRPPRTRAIPPPLPLAWWWISPSPGGCRKGQVPEGNGSQTETHGAEG